jgi:hypothetical protein
MIAIGKRELTRSGEMDDEYALSWIYRYIELARREGW